MYLPNQGNFGRIARGAYTIIYGGENTSRYIVGYGFYQIKRVS